MISATERIYKAKRRHVEGDHLPTLFRNVRISVVMPAYVVESIAVIGSLALVLILTHLAGLVTRWHSHDGRLGVPPGPKPLPLIGNLHQVVGKGLLWLQLHEWSKTYGPVMYLSFAGQPLVVLSTQDAALDLLSRRGAQYSDRPHQVVASELVMKGKHLLLKQYDSECRLMQKLHAPLLNVAAANRYGPIQDREVRQLLVDLLNSYDSSGEMGLEFSVPLERTLFSIIHTLLYGYRFEAGQEQELSNIRASVDSLSRVVRLGEYLVDLVPVLNYLPRPLAPWKSEAEALYKHERDRHMENMDKGLANPGWNFSKQIHANNPDVQGLSAEDVAWGVGVLVDATDTAGMTMQWFAVACALHGARFVPQARQALDTVVGKDRLPTLEDRPHLVYIDAIVNELLRWRPVVPDGMPHATKHEDTYQGYRIPAGSVVVGNHWAITRDESVFGPDTDSFVPERWLVDENGDGRLTLKNLPLTGFGFGRRMCPGRHVARGMLFLLVARLLWAFEIEAAVVTREKSNTSEQQRVEPVRMKIDDMEGFETFNFRPKCQRAVFRPRGPWVAEVVAKEQRDDNSDMVSLLNQAAVVGGDIDGKS
ncbi:cytochrome P450 [Hypoxylon crocopeplum]|nr:cytochrome P450 [Hypoxylon crocopeplum]